MSVAPRPIVIATGNPHKVAEMRAIFGATRLPGGGAVEISGLCDLPGSPHPEPDEIGGTFEANAQIKALSYAEQTGLVCIADDSGLEVDALGGRPGVISSHYFNAGRTDGAALGLGRDERDRLNNECLLRDLRDVPFERRAARFVCVMAVAVPPGEGASRGTVLALFRADFEGRIGLPGGEAPPGMAHLEVPRGKHGFGYDPLLLLAPDFARTSAELDPDEKNRVSHRARAGAMLCAWIAAGGLGHGLDRRDAATLSDPPP